jgi:hypothetical protein
LTVGGRVKLLPAEAKKLGSDSNSGQFRNRSTTPPHRNWTLTPFSGVGLKLLSNQIFIRKLGIYMPHIGVRSETETGELIANFETNGIDLQILDEAPANSTLLRFIDPYGDLVINQLQLPILIIELTEMRIRSTSTELRNNLAKLISFLNAANGVHVYVRFFGD